MKKTAYLLTLACLVGGCMATHEIPLTVNPGVYATAEQLDSLPVLPSDLSQIKYIYLPDSIIGEDKEWLPTQDFVEDLMDSYYMVQLEPLPGKKDYKILDIQTDDDLLFITYDFMQNDTANILTEYPRVHAIYTREGKLVAQIGNPIKMNYKIDRRTNTMNLFPYKKDDDTQYIEDSRIQLNRKRKEVYLNEMGGRQVYFDYKGNYKRTEYSQIISNNILTTRNQKVGLNISGKVENWNKFYCTVLGQNGKPTGVAFKDDPLHTLPSLIYSEGMVQVDDDIMLGFRESDTIWQILPDKKVARYVCKGALSGAEKIKGSPLLSANKDHIISKGTVSANSNYVLIRSYYKGRVHFMMYDAQTNHCVMWMPHGTKSTSTLIQTYLSGQPSFMLLSDGALLGICYETPLELKKELSYELDLGAASQRKHDKREEQFIRNLKLDGGPVLFFVKLKKF